MDYSARKEQKKKQQQDGAFVWELLILLAVSWLDSKAAMVDEMDVVDEMDEDDPPAHHRHHRRP